MAEPLSKERARRLWYRLPVWLTRPVDFWWSWGLKTTYYVRVLRLIVPVWRTQGAPYSIRKALRDD